MRLYLCTGLESLRTYPEIWLTVLLCYRRFRFRSRASLAMQLRHLLTHTHTLRSVCQEQEPSFRRGPFLRRPHQQHSVQSPDDKLASGFRSDRKPRPRYSPGVKPGCVLSCAAPRGCYRIGRDVMLSVPNFFANRANLSCCHLRCRPPVTPWL